MGNVLLMFVDKLYSLTRLYEVIALLEVLDSTSQLIALCIILTGRVDVVGVYQCRTQSLLHLILVDCSMDDVGDILLLLFFRLLLILTRFYLVPSIQIVLGSSECHVQQVQILDALLQVFVLIFCLEVRVLDILAIRRNRQKG